MALRLPLHSPSRASHGRSGASEAKAQHTAADRGLGSNRVSLLLAVGMTLFYNLPFWLEMLRLRDGLTLRNVLFFASLAVLLAAVFNLLFSLSAFRFVQKPCAILLLMPAAVASYYIRTYGVLIDSTMIRNVVETDTREAIDLLTPRLVLWVLALGVLPAWAVYRVRIVYAPWRTELRRRAAGILLSVAAIVAAVAPFYADYASIFPQERHLRHMITPSNLVYATAKILYESVDGGPPTVQPLGLDARRLRVAPPRGAEGKKTVLLLVVGETARAQQFSLNGYVRETNPALRQEGAISFDNVRSCGTSTVVSLPCMFSNQTRASFDGGAARRSEGLLDVLAHAGLSVAWRENNSGGCKGACDRIDTQEPEQLWDPEFCRSGECFDEVLLHDLGEQLDRAEGDAVVVLHQQGSHGPAYYRRYPDAFRRFTPTCDSSQLQDCAEQTIVNTYDNTILYTDYFLGRVIEFLRGRSDRGDTAMLYISDHGESLGENNVYLHGLPYFVAPDEQTRVPWIVWLSPEFERRSGIDASCLEARRDEALSHDNLFHSVLGLADVGAGIYDDGLDLFAACRRPAVATAAFDGTALAGESAAR